MVASNLSQIPSTSNLQHFRAFLYAELLSSLRGCNAAVPTTAAALLCAGAAASSPKPRRCTEGSSHAGLHPNPAGSHGPGKKSLTLSYPHDGFAQPSTFPFDILQPSVLDVPVLKIATCKPPVFLVLLLGLSSASYLNRLFFVSVL